MVLWKESRRAIVLVFAGGRHPRFGGCGRRELLLERVENDLQCLNGRYEGLDKGREVGDGRLGHWGVANDEGDGGMVVSSGGGVAMVGTPGG